MTTPDLVLTTLGAANSGRSVFLLGMYDILSTGLHGYFTFTEDPDQAVDLHDAWDLLVDEGELPPHNETDQSKHYRFVFSHGFTPLVTIDWMDYRGGALDARTAPGFDARTAPGSDVIELQERLNRSDSIYLVLDGGIIAKWLDDPAKLPFVQRKLQVRAMTDHVQQAINCRKEQGLPLPSIVVIITKVDLLRTPERRVGQALAQAVDQLKELLPVVFAPGITALVCPVKVGDFGEESTGIVDVSTIDPVGLHRPMIFSLMHFLTLGVGGGAREMDKAAASLTEVEQELAALRRDFAGFLRTHKTAQLRGVTAAYTDTSESAERQTRSDQDLIARLSQELEAHPIIRSDNLDIEHDDDWGGRTSEQAEPLASAAAEAEAERQAAEQLANDLQLRRLRKGVRSSLVRARK
jgi:hypothetical protein